MIIDGEHDFKDKASYNAGLFVGLSAAQSVTFQRSALAPMSTNS